MKGEHRPVTCQECPLRVQPAFRPFAEPELSFVSGFKAGELIVQAGHDVLLVGTNSAHLFTLFSGWAFRYHLLPDGQRQILNFLLPGDFLGLQSSVFDTMEHSVQALTKVQLCLFARTRLWELYRDCPSLAFDTTWLAAHEESMVDENLASVGQRPARARIAFLFLHLVRRLEGLGLVVKDACDFPLTQQHIADATGLSLVHTNKTLRRLVTMGLLELANGRLVIRDRAGLERTALYEPHEPRPRPIL